MRRQPITAVNERKLHDFVRTKVNDGARPTRKVMRTVSAEKGGDGEVSAKRGAAKQGEEKDLYLFRGQVDNQQPTPRCAHSQPLPAPVQASSVHVNVVRLQWKGVQKGDNMFGLQ